MCRYFHIDYFQSSLCNPWKSLEILGASVCFSQVSFSLPDVPSSLAHPGSVLPHPQPTHLTSPWPQKLEVAPVTWESERPCGGSCKRGISGGGLGAQVGENEVNMLVKFVFLLFNVYFL